MYDLTVENLSKTYGESPLFEQLSFTINRKEKVALIAKNGTGKTTLLKLITQSEPPDTGQIQWAKDIKIGYLSQDVEFDNAQNVLEAIFESDTPLMQAVKNYEQCLLKNDTKALELAIEKMEQMQAWDYEVKLKQILTTLEIEKLDLPINVLSGGQKKRLALARVLIGEPDFLILDEPTNHLDLDMIEWLEKYLKNQNITLFMVTHDRYFLERICNIMLELDSGQLYRYEGNYSYFLQKKAEREASQLREVASAKSIYKKELDWVRRQPKARGTKSKSRVEAFGELEKLAKKDLSEQQLQLEVKGRRMGKKVLEVKHLNKAFENITIVKDFSYLFGKQERIGIIGKNGVGKSTFLNLLMGLEQADSGDIEQGQTIVIGYYQQGGIPLKEDIRVIDLIKEIADYIPLAKGRQVSASQMLERFLFTPAMQYQPVSSLSGGEKRRLYLLTILMTNPNFLILDEPTNDLDIISVTVLENFLEEFEGCTIVVSHDRYFMDKLVQRLFVFEGQGKITNSMGTYSDYRERQALKLKEHSKKSSTTKNTVPTQKIKTPKKKGLSFKEKREKEQLELEMEELETKKSQLNDLLNQGGSDFSKLQQLSEEFAEVEALLEAKELRWLELAEKEE